MKILIADKFPAAGVAELQAIGCDVVVDPELKDDSLVTAIRDTGPDVLIVRSTKVTEPMLDAGNLRLVIRAGAGYNTIDVKAASLRGIFVSNCPGKNAIAVAELAFGLILSLDRRIADNVADIRRGIWNKKEYGKARGLFGRTLGLIGLGRIGVEMIPRAKAFGMNVVGWSRPMTYARAAELGITLLEEPEEVAAASDVLSIHLALNDGTRGKIGESIIGAMRPGAILVNTSRAEIVDQAVLERAIVSKGLRAGLDVFDGEPATGTADVNVPIASLPGVYVTHHIGASTDQAQDAIAAETVRIVRQYRDTGRVPNVVNLAERTPATHMIVTRHRDRVGVLAHVLTALRTAGINVQEMENIVFEGAEAAIARIQVDAEPSADLLAHICENEHVLATDVLNLV